MKDNNQSANLRALIDAGVRSFKIEGRYKDMGYVKNITAHYRTLLDEIIEARGLGPPAGARVQRAHHLHLHARPARTSTASSPTTS
jgi:collagenase-like PrtC family protease